MHPKKPSAWIVLFRPICAVLGILAAFVGCPATLQATVIIVPFDSATIQGAIAGAIDGDTIRVAPGVYHENLDFLGKGIVVESMSGPSSTVILGDSLNPVAVFSSAEDTSAHLVGFAVRSGGSSNIFCSNASPHLTSCLIDSSGGVGISLMNSAAIITGCTIERNLVHGLLLSNSPVSITACNISFNGQVGVYGDYILVFDSNIVNVNGSYPMVLAASSIGRISTTNRFMGNGESKIGVMGGTIDSSATWKKLTALTGYAILGSSSLSIQGASAPTLTIDPGVRIEFTATTGTILVGSGGQGGLMAQAPASDPIVFTRHYSVPMWQGIRFEGGAKDEGCILRNCIIRGAQSLICSFSSPTIDSCRIDSSASDGLQVTGSLMSITNCTIADNAGHGIWLNSATVTITGCDISGNGGTGVYGTSLAVFTGNTVHGNIGRPLVVGPNSTGRIASDNIFFDHTDPAIGVLSGTVSESATWNYFDGIYRYVVAATDHLRVRGAGSPVLTLAPGVRLEFANANYGLIIGQDARGGLVADGDSDQPVIMTNDPSVASWYGPAFYPLGIDSACALRNTVIRRARSLWLLGDTLVTIDSCRVDSCVDDGLNLTGAQIKITHCAVIDNAGSGVYLGGTDIQISDCQIAGSGEHGVSGTGLTAFAGNTVSGSGQAAMSLGVNSVGVVAADNVFSANAQPIIAVNAGILTESATWRVLPGIECYLLGTNGITYIQGTNSPVLTLEPGVHLEFASQSFGLRIGFTGAGGLIADATDGPPIVFAPHEGTDSWAGLRFGSSAISASCTLKNCIIRRAGQVECSSVSPTFAFCRIDSSASTGLTLTNNASRISDCTIADNAVHGILLANSTTRIERTQIIGNGQIGLYCRSESKPLVGSFPGFGCDLSGNGTYALYNDGSQIIFARNNVWGADDSASVAALIWDVHDDPTKGLVEFQPFELGYICGDINGDGSNPNVADLVYLVSYLFRGGPMPPSWDGADVNNDNHLNVSDLTYMVIYLFHGGPAPVCRD